MIMFRHHAVFCGVALTLLCACTESSTPNESDAGRLNDAHVRNLDASVVVDTALPLDIDATTHDVFVAPLDGSIDATEMTSWEPAGPPDLVLNHELLEKDIWFDEIEVDESNCALLEGCIDGVGRRRLMRFAVGTGNIGNEDLLIGDVSQLTDEVEYSACHEHYHYSDYADYRLMRDEGVIRLGHKQAFCLMDTRPMSMVNRDATRARARYNCRFQGISAGWEDVYGSRLDCQWIDITGLQPGQYDLEVRINPEGVLKEHRYDNNNGRVTVDIPSADFSRPCGENERSGLKSACGWRLERDIECHPNALVRVGAGGCYGIGACTEALALRVCHSGDGACASGVSLAESEKGCGDSACPYLEFQCPLAGRATLWVKDADSMQQYRVDVVQNDVDLLASCLGASPIGLERLCGWTDNEILLCEPGRRYRIGCGDMSMGCDKPSDCQGDPMLRVCESMAGCVATHALTENDDACASRCPMAIFTCPSSGKVQAYTGPFRANENFSCRLSTVLLPDH
ncbi:MAG: lysyl oxidase family protein [Bradymonadia bacterium]